MLTRDIFRYLLSRLFPGLVNFLALAVFSRVVTPDAYGEFAYIFAIVMFFHAVAFRWIEQGLQRIYPSAGSLQERQLIASCSFLLLIPTFAVCGALLLAAGKLGTIESGIVNAQFWTLCFLAGVVINELSLEAKRAEIRPWHYGALVAARSVAAFVLSAILVWNNRDNPLGLLIGTAGAYLAVGLIGSLGYLRRTRADVPLRSVARRLAVFGLPLVLSNFFLYLITTSDRLIIARFWSDAEVGVYSMGYDFVQQTIIVMATIVNLAAYPLLLRIYEQHGDAATIRFLPGVFSALFVVSMPIAVLFILNGAAISRWYFGEMYSGTIAMLLPPVTLAMIVASIKAFYADQAFLLRQKTMHMAIPIALGGLINVGANLYVVPRWGGVGAAWTTLLAYGVSLVASLLYGRTFLKVPWPWAVLGRVAVACGVEAAVLLLWKPAPSVVGEVVRCGSACAVFVASAWKMGLLNLARTGGRA